MPNLSALYKFRFSEAELPKKMRIWNVLCQNYFQRAIPPNASVLDLACGYGEFINNIRAGEKHAVDLNPDAKLFLSEDVRFYQCPADDISALDDCSIDVVFTSNFLEHLESKHACDRVLGEVKRILRPGGTFIVMGPNIRYLADRYWDFYDHYLPLSHLSMEEGLVQAGYEVSKIVPKFLPYTTRSLLPQHPVLIAAYLKLKPAWWILGKQFLIISRKPTLPATR